MLCSNIEMPMLEPIEKASIDEIRSLQFQRLNKSVSIAYENIHSYRVMCDEIGVHPGDLKDLDDLSHFPFVDKEFLRENYPFGAFAVPMSDIVRVHASSGTTGKPTVVGYTKKDIEIWSSLIERSIKAAGGNKHDIVQIALNYGLFTGGLGAHYGAEKLGCTVIPTSGGQTERQAKLMYDFEPSIIMATPSYLLNIIEAIETSGEDPRSTKLRLGILGAEPWTQEMRTNLENKLNIDALDLYGLSELLGPGVAMECIESKDGPTIWEDHFYPEIIDPETKKVLPDGEYGELVLTTLTKEALPLIRYRTHDLTRLLPGTARSMRRIDRVKGRSDDMIIVRGVNIFPSQIEEQLLKIEIFSPHYQIQVSREKNLDVLTINVEAIPWAGEYALNEAKEQLNRSVKSVIGISCIVEIKGIGSLPRSSGKLSRVQDNR